MVYSCRDVARRRIRQRPGWRPSFANSTITSTRPGVATARRVLDVGCGWGALAATVHGAEPDPRSGRWVDAQRGAGKILPSIACRGRRASGGWRIGGTTKLRPRTTRIISIGAFEHFAAPGDSRETRVAKYKEFFEFCRANLRRGGRLSLQTIAYLNMRREDASTFMNTGDLSGFGPAVPGGDRRGGRGQLSRLWRSATTGWIMRTPATSGHGVSRRIAPRRWRRPTRPRWPSSRNICSRDRWDFSKGKLSLLRITEKKP